MNYTIITQSGNRLENMAEDSIIQLIDNGTINPNDSISNDGVTWHMIAEVVEIGGKTIATRDREAQEAIIAKRKQAIDEEKRKEFNLGMIGWAAAAIGILLLIAAA